MLINRGFRACVLCGLYGTHAHTEPEIDRLLHSADNPSLVRLRGLLEERPQFWRHRQARTSPPVRRLAAAGSLPPSCIYCGGKTRLTGQTTYAIHIQAGTKSWRCREEWCPGYDDGIITQTPLAEYERRC
jgi:hypothetical protein